MDDRTAPSFACKRQSLALDYWQRRCTNGRIPYYKAFDPIDVPQLLPHLVVFDVLRYPLDFRYRLIGDEIRTHMGRNVVGLCMREAGIHTEDSDIFRHVREVADSGEPRFYSMDCVGSDRSRGCQQGLTLPFTDHGEHVDKIIEVLSFQWHGSAIPDERATA